MDTDEIHFDNKLKSLVIKHTDHWIVSVTSMIFNDRVMLTSREEYLRVKWPNPVGGWCYDKGGAAIMAAVVWNPDTEDQPVGFKKEAFNCRVSD